MKKLLLYSLAVFLFASSCSKERSSQNKPPVNTGKKYAVKFNVDGFTQTINTINKKTLDAVTPSGIAGNATVLYYYAQNSAGSFVTQIKQTSASAGFGTVTDSLPAGTYTILLLAGQTGLKTSYLDLSAQNAGLKGFYFTYNIAPGQFAPWQDTFYKKFTITVSDQGLTQSVSLDRVVGEIQVNVEDAIPANLKTIKLNFNYEDAGFRVDVEQPVNTFSSPRSYTTTTTIPDTAIGKTNFKINTIIGNTITPINVTITCLDAANNTLSVTTVPNVSCQKNVKTVLSGKLFANASAFNISVDPTWDPAPINIHF